MPNLNDLRTPALLLDQAKLQRNLDHMAARATALGVNLRPHMKTAKSIEVAKLATRGQEGGITVSTLAEADYFARAGFTDILYGVGITRDKLADVDAIQDLGATVTMILDNFDCAQDVVTRTNDLSGRFGFLIEIDCGQHRTGLLPDDAQVLQIARLLDGARNCELRGVMTHAGHSYNCDSIAAMREVAEAERAAVVAAAEIIRANGLPCEIVSVGSTPTALHAEHLTGVTEMRPGVFMFGDLFQQSIGSCELEDLAVSVLTSVIAWRDDEARAMVDAGALALSLDRGAPDGNGDYAYGMAADLDGRPLPGDLRIRQTNQEHGFLPGLKQALRVGDRLRVLPNHVCSTAAQYDRYHIIDESGEIIDSWTRTGGW
ncbi:MAG: DSD1 family PLP-dependent enzyme [Rhodospirillaceae bacterium]|jgi:D-serine deaminase-like pyridoxal phosphate-dependent protein|nr:DSD1 family PLP-dependent enzyme [Rhodospirillaceae bacterium]MBT4688980.1 DSD1 family PLP-dependent enzyme [Rhodospirillaceae bacterium]MBT5083667.1 DSD1 family PLP-dependent enzyme [Rhodospirillaceae bacterium]MBT5522543.1 DSD1 family PLP-dependent enzyme [Rhodospirillaceae bacterium]MBT5878587.1 DSD1 family PLP-dependent enzyme [Rhodospirillaceae bacterium]